jgi:N12 class adenine-specific DNA methylase
MAAGEQFRPRGQQELGPSGQVSRITANLAALKTLRQIQEGQRPATPGEQAFLARWSSWGAVPQIFDEDSGRFAAEREELRTLLTGAEYAAARRTTINAHYTDAALVRAIWKGVQQLGFTAGQVLEPGCGSGNFIGLAPPAAHVLGVELDPVTAGIAAALYPEAQVRTESFADTRLPDGAFDLVIGNVPFSQARLHDPRHNAAGHSIHNHFIIKGLHLTRPGGLVAVLTSRYTLDAQDHAARTEMAALAELVTAVRLPGGTHRRAAGTEAVTDLLILRHRDGQQPATPSGPAAWERSVQVDLPGGSAWINEYLHARPDQVLGVLEVGGGQYNSSELLVRPAGDLADVPEQLAGALDHAASGAAATGLMMTAPAAVLERAAAPPVTSVSLRVPSVEAGRFEGTVTANDDGTFSVLNNGQAQPWPCPRNQAAELRRLLKLRDSVTALLDAEAASAEDTLGIGQLRAELNRRYDGYRAAHGPLNRVGWRRTGRTDETGKDIWARQLPAQGGFRQDPYAATVYALEDFQPDTGQAAKAAIFTQRVIGPRHAPASADTPADAVVICLDTDGEIRLDTAARLLGAPSPHDARASLGELVYDEPGTGRLVPAAEYLSGKVRVKLAEAEQAAEADPQFAVNVAALRRVLPADLGPGDIDARLGAAWIGPQHVQQGLREILEDPGLTVAKGHGSTWKIEGETRSVLASEIWGTQEKDALSLASCLLEQRPVRVFAARSDADDPPHVKRRRQMEAATATVAARAKADELSNKFTDWLWEDPQRSAELARTYNERFNSLVLRSYDGAQLSLPGLAASFRPRPHQVAAVARVISEPAVLLAHEVGAGKTAEMVMGAMELRRLGMALKPAIVVPNHMLEQFSREFMQLYPQAQTLAAGIKNLERARRKTFVARIATGNWDAVIMSRSVFERIPMSAGAQKDYMAAQLADYDAWLERARGAGEKRSIVKKMETKRLMREERLKKKLDRARDAGISWEQTGIDYIFLDEAHGYKNLDTRSNNAELSIDGSTRASDLDMKLDYLRRTHGRRVATFATATPIANSMSEAYVMTGYLRPDLLAEAGIEDFDGWAGTFAETTSDVEVAPEGGIRVKDRFARFRNVPELLRMWHVAADVKTGEDLQLPTPALAGGKPEVITTEGSAELRSFMATLADRADAVRRRAVLPDEDNMLKISSDGRAAALDLRLIGIQPPEEGKLDTAAGCIASIWQQHRQDSYPSPGGHDDPVRGSLQIVFCDLGTPSSAARKAGRWTAYDYLREQLAARGVPAAQVRFMHEARSDKDKAELFAAARAGKIAVLIGSTELMGVGTNVQDRAVALHHLDCPWRPADVAQREGRILRQGNRNSEVRILRYVTEGSFDAYMWQTVTRKAKFIAQVMHGTLDSREIEDVAPATLSYSEVTALASGDMRILAKAQADADVQRLERLHASWRRSQHSLKTRITDAEQRITQLTARAKAIDTAISGRRDTRGDAFAMTVGSAAFTKRTDAAESLQHLVRRQAEIQRGRGRIDVTSKVGSLGGFTLNCTTKEFLGTVAVVLVLEDVPSGRIEVSGSDLHADKPPLGLITKLENRLSGLEHERTATTEDIARLEAEIERAQANLGAPFAKAEELARARSNSERLAQELGGTPDSAEDDPVFLAEPALSLDSATAAPGHISSSPPAPRAAQATTATPYTSDAPTIPRSGADAAQETAPAPQSEVPVTSGAVATQTAPETGHEQQDARTQNPSRPSVPAPQHRTTGAADGLPQHRPTPEQDAIISACASGDNLVIEAGAGTGKTSTLRMASSAMRHRTGLYVAYNKAIAAEAQGSFPPNVTCATAHSLAFQATGRRYAHRLPPHSRRLPSRDIAVLLGIHEPLRLDSQTVLAPAQLARIAMTTVDRFCESADPHPAPSHVLAINGIDATGHAQLARWATRLAGRAWQDISNPDGRLPFSHDHYLKMWQLTGPRIPADFILFDEAQDASPVIAAIIQDQDGAQKIAVGDSCQAIYGWRGAVDALATWPADTRLMLSQSFRFGEPVADEANKWLDNLGAALRLSGTPAIASTIGPVERADAVLCRTNAQAISETLTALESGSAVALVGGGKDIKQLATAAQELQDTGHTSHPELMAFQSWSDVQDYAQNDESGADLATFVRLVDSHGPSAVISAIARLSREDQASVTISTAHKAKGREWDQVRIATDFREPKPGEQSGEPGKIPRPDAMLAYVAVTRARKALDRGGLAWIDNYTGQHLPETAASAVTLNQAEADQGTPAASSGQAVRTRPVQPQAVQDAAEPDPPSPATTIRIDHDATGTRVSGTSQHDTALHQALKETGFKWSERQDYWYLPRRWTHATRTSRVGDLSRQLTQLGRPYERADTPSSSAETPASTPQDRLIPSVRDLPVASSTPPPGKPATDDIKPGDKDSHNQPAALFEIEPANSQPAPGSRPLPKSRGRIAGQARPSTPGGKIVHREILRWRMTGPYLPSERLLMMSCQDAFEQGDYTRAARVIAELQASIHNNGHPNTQAAVFGASLDHYLPAKYLREKEQHLKDRQHQEQPGQPPDLPAIKLNEPQPRDGTTPVPYAGTAESPSDDKAPVATAGSSDTPEPDDKQPVSGSVPSADPDGGSTTDPDAVHTNDPGQPAEARPYAGGRAQAESGSRIIEDDYLAWTKIRARATVDKTSAHQGRAEQLIASMRAVSTHGLADGPGSAAARYEVMAHAASALGVLSAQGDHTAEPAALARLADHTRKHAERLNATATRSFLRSSRAGTYSGGRSQAESGSRIIEDDYLTWTRTPAAAQMTASATYAELVMRARSAWTAIRRDGLADGPRLAADRYGALAQAARQLASQFGHDLPSADLIPLLQLTEHADKHAFRLRATADASPASRAAEHGRQSAARNSSQESSDRASSYQLLPPLTAAVAQHAHAKSSGKNPGDRSDAGYQEADKSARRLRVAAASERGR